MSESAIDLQQDFFTLFDLPQRFKFDGDALDRRYRELQTQVHPDKSAHLSDAEQRLAMQGSTRVNEGYQTLRDPIKRARYLLSLNGVDTQEESNTTMPMDFLMQQMEMREALQEAVDTHDLDTLDELSDATRDEMRQLQQELAEQIDYKQAYVEAAGIVRKLRFFEKMAEEIADAYDELDP